MGIGKAILAGVTAATLVCSARGDDAESVDFDRVRAFVKDYCHRELHPVVTPLTVNPAHPFPRVVNKALCIAVLLRDQERIRHLLR